MARCMRWETRHSARKDPRANEQISAVRLRKTPRLAVVSQGVRNQALGKIMALKQQVQALQQRKCLCLCVRATVHECERGEGDNESGQSEGVMMIPQGVRNQALGKKVARDQQVQALQQRLEGAAAEGAALRRALEAKQSAVGGLEGRLQAQRKRIIQLERAFEAERGSCQAAASKVHPLEGQVAMSRCSMIGSYLLIQWAGLGRVSKG